MTFSRWILCGLILSSILLFGCTQPSMLPVPPQSSGNIIMLFNTTIISNSTNASSSASLGNTSTYYGTTDYLPKFLDGQNLTNSAMHENATNLISDKNLTAPQFFGSVDWLNLINFPAACSAGQAITKIDGVPICASFVTSAIPANTCPAGYALQNTTMGGGDCVALNSTAIGNLSGSLTANRITKAYNSSVVQDSSMVDDGHTVNFTLPSNFSTYLDLMSMTAPSAPSIAGFVRLFSYSTQGHDRPAYMDNEGTIITIGRDNFVIVRNTAGFQINKGQAVHVMGSTGTVPNVNLARADSNATMPALGLMMYDCAINAFCYTMLLGNFQNFDTSAFAANSQVWVSPTTAGGLVNVRPVYPNLVQRMGTILVQGVGNGVMEVTTAPFIGGQDTGTTANNFTVNGTLTAQIVIANTYLGLPYTGNASSSCAGTNQIAKMINGTYVICDPNLISNATGIYFNQTMNVTGNLNVNGQASIAAGMRLCLSLDCSHYIVYNTTSGYVEES